MSGRIPSRGSDQFVVRFPDGMRDMIAEAAKRNGRSMNSEIIDRLAGSFAAPRVTDQITLDRGQVTELAEAMKKAAEMTTDLGGGIRVTFTVNDAEAKE